MLEILNLNATRASNDLAFHGPKYLRLSEYYLKLFMAAKLAVRHSEIC